MEEKSGILLSRWTINDQGKTSLIAIQNVCAAHLMSKSTSFLCQVIHGGAHLLHSLNVAVSQTISARQQILGAHCPR